MSHAKCSLLLISEQQCGNLENCIEAATVKYEF